MRLVEHFDLGQFLSSLLATLSGSTVVAVVSFTVLSRQRRDRYQEQLLSLLRTSIAAIMTFSRAVVFDENESERSRMVAHTELMLLGAATRGNDARLANLIATEFWYLSDAQNAARSRTTAELASHLSAMANSKIPRKVIAESVHETAKDFRPHAQAPDSAYPGPNSEPA